MEFLLLSIMQQFLEFNYRYVDPSDRNWDRFETAANSGRYEELRLCMIGGSSVQVSPKVLDSAEQVCYQTMLGNPRRTEEICFEKADVRYLGLPSRKLVVGTPGGPDACPVAASAVER